MISDQSCLFFWRPLVIGHCIQLAHTYKHVAVVILISQWQNHVILNRLSKKEIGTRKMEEQRSEKWECRMKCEEAIAQWQKQQLAVGTWHGHTGAAQDAARGNSESEFIGTDEESRRPRSQPGASYEGTKKKLDYIRNRTAPDRRGLQSQRQDALTSTSQAFSPRPRQQAPYCQWVLVEEINKLGKSPALELMVTSLLRVLNNTQVHPSWKKILEINSRCEQYNVMINLSVQIPMLTENNWSPWSHCHKNGKTNTACIQNS